MCGRGAYYTGRSAGLKPVRAGRANDLRLRTRAVIIPANNNMPYGQSFER